jgi:hypothetical protein
MRDLLFAEWLRLRRYWLPRTLLILLVVIVALQLNGKRNELETLRIEVEAGISDLSGEPLRPEQIEGAQLRIQLLEGMLRYPAVIGTAIELSTGAGWYFLILLTAVMGGEDFSRRTLSCWPPSAVYGSMRRLVHQVKPPPPQLSNTPHKSFSWVCAHGLPAWCSSLRSFSGWCWPGNPDRRWV